MIATFPTSIFTILSIGIIILIIFQNVILKDSTFTRHRSSRSLSIDSISLERTNEKISNLLKSQQIGNAKEIQYANSNASFDLLIPKTRHNSSTTFITIFNQDPNTKEITADHNFSKHFAPFEIANKPLQELKACIQSEVLCTSFPEIDSTWPKIEEDVYRKVIRNLELHTSYLKSKVTFASEAGKICKINSEITLNFQAKNRLDQNKQYGGDFILARMVPLDYPNFEKYKSAGAKFDPAKATIILGQVIDHLNGKYTIKIPCILAGQFRVEIILIRNSEAISALLKMFNSMNAKSRIAKGILSDGTSLEDSLEGSQEGESDRCSPFIPNMLPGGDPSQVCPINLTPGREWFCKKPNTTESCEGQKLIWQGNHKGKQYMNPAWYVYTVTDPLGLDDVYEDLVFSDKIIVLTSKLPDSQKADSHNKIPGYWLRGHWIDRIFPQFSQKISKGEILKDKTFIKLGDSIVGQVSAVFKDEVRTYISKLQLGKSSGSSRKKTYFDFLGLDIHYHKNCEPLSGWGATRTIWPMINHTSITITEGLPVMKDQCPGKSIYAGEVIERMEKYGVEWYGKDKIVFFTHGAHFSQWNPVIYYNRLIDIRNSIISFKKKSPDSIFIYKTLNYMRGNFTKNYASISAFQAFRQREIAFKVFGNPYLDDIRGDDFPVKVYDVFPLTLAAFEHMNPGNVHPPGFLRLNTANLMVDLMRYVGYI